ncbi:MAG: carbon-nitrogen hydrolase family protein [Clostridia bacterium]|nr:carbon-nitrogen hydrolase family protein [Clostridia bacterium]
MKVAMLQVPVGFDKQKNIIHAMAAVEWAAGNGADIAVLPEMWNCPYSNKYFPDYAEEGIGESRAAMSDTAKRLSIYLVGGSIPEREDGKVYNTAFVYDREGREIARHRKVHLFDIDVKGGQRFFESETFTAGNEVTLFDTEWGRMGLCICFDMRFPELSRIMSLEGAKAVFVPAAFNMTTGPAHWETMFRQRAVDNQLFTIGVSPARDENGVYVAYGNSIVVDPWGSVIARMDGAANRMVVDIDLKRVDDIRAQLPLMSARREDVYKIKRV